MIKGFLHREGRKVVNGVGEEILLKGWGLGNWLLQEGYMWHIFSPRFDRPRRIEQVVEELAGKKYADTFWKKFREQYVTRADIMKMAELGYNSVRIPMNYRVFMEDGPGIHWKEEGFQLVDQCLAWCEEAGIYAFLDLHGAPGGQTGSNIDDSVDDVPRLFIDQDSWDKTIALWVKLAERYAGREVVGGYDLLNEPIIPPRDNGENYDGLIPMLGEFYDEAIREIRKVDQDHMFSIEGAHWATDVQVFDHLFDENMVLHFHRYAEKPDYACLKKFMDKAEEWDVPLWLGETGENVNEWYAALYPLCESLGIGYNLWPWKKMECTNSPYSIKAPDGYEAIMNYVERGAHPGFEKAQKILDQYLENIKIENCTEEMAVTHHVLRMAPFSIRATDFDEFPGLGNSYSGTANETPRLNYRKGCGMELVELQPEGKQAFAFDCQWDRFGLVLHEKEFASYRVQTERETRLDISVVPGYGAAEMVVEDGSCREIQCLEVTEDRKCVHAELPKGITSVRIVVRKGCTCLERLSFH